MRSHRPAWSNRFREDLPSWACRPCRNPCPCPLRQVHIGSAWRCRSGTSSSDRAGLCHRRCHRLRANRRFPAKVDSKLRRCNRAPESHRCRCRCPYRNRFRFHPPANRRVGLPGHRSREGPPSHRPREGLPSHHPRRARKPRFARSRSDCCIRPRRRRRHPHHRRHLRRRRHPHHRRPGRRRRRLPQAAGSHPHRPCGAGNSPS